MANLFFATDKKVAKNDINIMIETLFSLYTDTDNLFCSNFYY